MQLFAVDTPAQQLAVQRLLAEDIHLFVRTY
jgi:hypothetical protein